MSTAVDLARARVARVRDDPEARLALMHRLYRGDDSTFLPYRRGAVAFTRWQVRRGLLRPPDDQRPGSPWWRAVNERLLRDGWEARALADGHDPAGGTASALPTLDFIRHPTAPRWYRAHNASIVTAFLEHRHLAEQESRTERFFIDLVLLRVLYAHALVSAPRLALGRLAPIAPVLGDPRVRMTGLFLAISRVLPDTYPLGDDVESYVAVENRWGRLLDVGVIQPRRRAIYDWSASELGEPALRDLLADDVPCYAWPPDDRGPWFPPPTVLTRLARRVVPPR
ncbi:hypothetical protein [Actinomycetospora straminea]|uniref:Uncharacterized protein n=1 Tax=Actinomycetospora straminea TaxID=663607 RepID=A0ABP9E547_9PSEU|nr:hypothetical protein [Actinomycetospora straminea]MDD7930873.1 hypothetical protein [Actinomycetospora straminea]